MALCAGRALVGKERKSVPGDYCYSAKSLLELSTVTVAFRCSVQYCDPASIMNDQRKVSWTSLRNQSGCEAGVVVGLDLINSSDWGKMD